MEDLCFHRRGSEFAEGIEGKHRAGSGRGEGVNKGKKGEVTFNHILIGRE
jgi:hypothetical protein